MFFIYYIKYIKYINIDIIILFGDWGLGIGPNPQSPIPNYKELKYNNNYYLLFDNKTKSKIYIF